MQLTIYSAKSKEVFTVNSLVTSRDKIGFRYLASKYVGIFVADKTGWHFGVLLTTVLCTLDYHIVSAKFVKEVCSMLTSE